MHLCGKCIYLGWASICWWVVVNPNVDLFTLAWGPRRADNQVPRRDGTSLSRVIRQVCAALHALAPVGVGVGGYAFAFDWR